MIQEQHIIIANCDKADSGDCWEEIIVSLNEGEEKEDGLLFLQSQGWKILGNTNEEEELGCICPGCNIGKRKPEEGLRLVDDEWED